MSDTSRLLPEHATAALPTIIRNAGIAGAGGAGFPTYAKWTHLESVDYLLVNHQESEPGFYKDKWLARTHADTFADLFEAFLEAGLFDTIVVSAKVTDRDEWLGPLADATGATVRTPDELPIDPSAESGVVIACTENRYQYGMENVLLKLVADVVVGSKLPMDHGWLVQNTETLYNVYQILADETPVLDKYVHVDGNTPRHRFLRAPIGTPVSTLLEAAGVAPATLGHDQVLADGGPGWCSEIDVAPERVGVRKSTNGVLVLNRDVVDAHRFGSDRINVLGMYDWGDEPETRPSEHVTPESVLIPRITNAALGNLVTPSEPVVQTGDQVERGDVIAEPHPRGFSNTQHSSIGGTVTAITDSHIEIRSRE